MLIKYLENTRMRTPHCALEAAVPDARSVVRDLARAFTWQLSLSRRLLTDMRNVSSAFCKI